MKHVSLFLFSLPAFAASLMTGGVSSNGVWVNYETRLEPGSPPIRKHGGGSLTVNDVIKRHLCNFENNTYTGYDLVIEPAGEGRFRLRFSPLTITPQKMTEIFDEVPNWKQLAMPGGPATMEVRAGETVALDLFVNPSTGQKITDYLTVTGSKRPQVSVSGAAQQAGPEQDSLEISSPQVAVDGNKAASSGGSVRGEPVWIDLPGHGRFVFSLAPRDGAGFQKAGEVRGTAMTWRSGGREYKVTTDRPVASRSRAFHLYVLHIPVATDVFVMSAGSLDAATHK